MSHPQNAQKLPSSFRDPDGFLFNLNGILYRQVNQNYQKDYDHLIKSGLYEILTKSGLLIPHAEKDTQSPYPDQAYKIIKPEIINFISYPYEWCFSQLKDAALLTLQIQKESIGKGMSLKDCSAFNIQFKKGKPVFIDSLSFEKYRKGEPWVAYRQFCQHFLAPLALMCSVDVRLNYLLKHFIDGIPLDLASKLLPLSTHFNFSLLTHIHLHSNAQKRFSDNPSASTKRQMSHLSFLGIIDSLETTIKKIKLKISKSEWSNYYQETNYSSESFRQKEKIVSGYLQKISPKGLWDLGSNTGLFSRIASRQGIQTISFDIDPMAIEKNYKQVIASNEKNLLPLVMDLTNPSAGTGFQNEERLSLIKRGPTEVVLALALIHHLAISNNLPFELIAQFFSKICQTLIVEFIPKEDSQVQRLLKSRRDIFPHYTQNFFEKEFKKFFTINHADKIKDSQRTTYLMSKK